MSHRIEPASASDFLNVAALDRIAWRQTDEPFIADGEHVWRVWCEYVTVLVCRHAADAPLSDSQDIAGASVVFPTDRGEWFMHKIMVHPQKQGKGIGTALMRAALERAPGSMLLTVDPNNTAAVKLYENFGFKIRQRIEGYYRRHEHRLLMVWGE